MQEIKQEKEKAILITCQFVGFYGDWDIEESEKELVQLVKSSHTDVLKCLRYKSGKPNSSLLIGTGKIEEISVLVKKLGATVLIFDHDLSAAQQRNIEDYIQIKTIDRTQLILDIFARHACSKEGKLQVELAQLNYLMPRLQGKGIYLSRLGAGIGTKGPGEQKLESDRRKIRNRISKISKELKKTSKRKLEIIKKRKESSIPVAGLAGYTNAGKTTLFNSLTDSQKMAKNSLFSTLDTVSRKLETSGGQKIILFDTIGFIHNLPHHLIEAFKATLEEIKHADIILHVLDAVHPLSEKKADAVFSVLKELESEYKPIITVLNKTDLVTNLHEIERKAKKYPNPVFVSAKNNTGFEELYDKILSLTENYFVKTTLSIPQNRMDTVSLVYDKGRVIDKKYKNSKVILTAIIPKHLKNSIEKHFIEKK